MENVNVAADDWQFWERKMQSVGTKGYIVPFVVGGIFALIFLFDTLLNVGNYVVDSTYIIYGIAQFAIAAAGIGYGVWKYKEYAGYKQKYEAARRTAGM